MKVKEEREKGGLTLSIQKTKIMANRWRNSNRFFFLESKVTAAMKLKDVWPWKKSYFNSRQHIEKQRNSFANKGPSSQSYVFFQ